MHKPAFVALSVFGMIAASPAAAQKSADVNYDCALFDECGQAAADAPEAPPAQATRGIRSSTNVRGGFTMRREPAQAAATANPAKQPRVQVPGNRPARIAKAGSTPTMGRMQAESIRAAQQITFVSGSAMLSPHAKLVAQKLATSMMRPDKAGLRYRIEGHTDAVGTRERNLELSKARAQSVVTYLGSLGVNTRNLDIAGYGFDQTLPGLPKTAAANRRVVAQVIK
jgi:OmpA-OmpF porin, OOP family